MIKQTDKGVRLVRVGRHSTPLEISVNGNIFRNITNAKNVYVLNGDGILLICLFWYIVKNIREVPINIKDVSN